MDPSKADVIVVLGGDSGLRALQALKLYRSGYAPNVVLIHVGKESKTTKAFFSAGAAEENIYYDSVARNSLGEAEDALTLIRKHGWKHSLIVTDPPHIRRVNWAWNHVLRGSGLKYTIVATSPPWWDAENWWKNKTSKDFVMSEYKKLAYYILVYGTGIPAEWFPVTVNR